MTKITTEERVEELVNQTLKQNDKVGKLQKYLVLTATIAAMTTGAAAFVHKFFVKPEIEHTSQEAAQAEAAKTKSYCVEKYLEMSEDMKDIKEELRELNRMLLQRRR